jgi:hypothetical protein
LAVEPCKVLLGDLSVRGLFRVVKTVNNTTHL